MWLAWTGCLALLLIGTAAADLATQYHSPSAVLVFGLVASTSGLVAQLVVGPGSTSPRRRTWDARRSPYPGLESFSVDDADVFFGREEHRPQAEAACSPDHPPTPSLLCDGSHPAVGQRVRAKPR
jgi:hypothetical protein